jgi:hypothetical protein
MGGKRLDTLLQTVEISVIPPPGVTPPEVRLEVPQGGSADVGARLQTRERADVSAQITASAPSCDPALSPSFGDLPGRRVPAGSTLPVTTKVAVAADTGVGLTLTCALTFDVSEDGDTESYVQHVTVVVVPPPGVSPPTVHLVGEPGQTIKLTASVRTAAGSPPYAGTPQVRCDAALSANPVASVARGSGGQERDVPVTVSIGRDALNGQKLSCHLDFSPTIASDAAFLQVIEVDVSSGAAVVPGDVDIVAGPASRVGIDADVRTPVLRRHEPVDVVLLADSTGSMGPWLAAIQEQATRLLDQLRAELSDARVAVADYKDVPPFSDDDYGLRVGADISRTDDGGTAARAAIAEWRDGGGGDAPEGQLLALHDITAGAIHFRPGAQRVVVWIGDAPGHDPVCRAADEMPLKLTEDMVREDLIKAHVSLFAISVGGRGLDDDPGLGGLGCANAGRSGQASRLTSATGGVHLTDVEVSELPGRIGRLLATVPVTISASISCPVGVQPPTPVPSKTVLSGESTTFHVPLVVDPTASPGSVLRCSITWSFATGPGVGSVPPILQMVAVLVPEMHAAMPVVRQGDVVDVAGRNLVPGGSYSLAGLPGAPLTVKADRAGLVTLPFLVSDEEAEGPRDVVVTGPGIAPGHPLHVQLLVEQEGSVPYRGDPLLLLPG